MAKNVEKAVVSKPVEKAAKPPFDWDKYVADAKAKYNQLVSVEMDARGADSDVEPAVEAVVKHTQAFVSKIKQNEAFSGYVKRVYDGNWNIDWNELFDEILSEQR